MAKLRGLVAGLLGLAGGVLITPAEVGGGNFSPASVRAETENNTLPGPVLNLVARPGIGTVALSWDPPAGISPYAIQGYKIEEYWRTQITHGRRTDRWHGVVANTNSRATTYLRDGILTISSIWLEFRVAAIVAGGHGEWGTITNVNTLANVIPQPPINVVAIPGPQQIELRWRPPADNGGAPIESYAIEFQLGDDAGWKIGALPDVTGTSFTHQNLLPEREVRYRLYARNRVGQSRATSAVANAIPYRARAPGTPTELVATAGITHVDLSWTAPSDTGEADRYWYQIEHSPNGEDGWQGTGGRVTGTEYKHVDLTPNTTYHYRVAGANLSGVGEYTATVEATTLRKRKPFAPTALSAVPYHDRIYLYWEAPAPSGDPITGYRVEYQGRTATNETWFVAASNTASTVPEYDHDDNRLGESDWRYRVQALIGSGTTPGERGDYSAALEVSPLGNQPPAPTLTYVSTGFCTFNCGGDVSITFNMPRYSDLPQNSGRGPVTSFSFQYSPIDRVAEVYWQELATFDNSNWTDGQTNIRVDKRIREPLQANARLVYFRLIARNAVGASPPSNTFEYRRGGIRINYPQRPSQPSQLTVRRRLASIEFRWNAPSSRGSPITSYVVEQSEDQYALDDDWDEVYSGPSHVHVATLDELPADFSTFLRVAAINAVGRGTWTQGFPVSVAAPGVPKAPNQPSATDGMNLVQVAWAAPVWNGGAPVTAYRLESSAVGVDGPWATRAEFDGTSYAYTHGGLTPGEQHYYRVFASNSHGEGPPSGVVSGMATASPPAAPNPLAIFSGQDSFALYWRAPADGGLPIQSYRIEHRSTETNDDWTELVVLDPSPLRESYIVSGVSEGVVTEFRVSATNGAGTGPPTDVVTGTANLTWPGMPQNVAAHEWPDRTEVSWEAPAHLGGAGATITQYRVDRSGDAGRNWQRIALVGGAETTYADRDAVLGDRALYRVFATNSVGLGLPSAATTAVPAAALPPVPYGVTVEPHGLQNTIRWAPMPTELHTDITGFRVEHAATAIADTWTPLTAVKPATADHAIHRDLGFGQTVYYRVVMDSEVGHGEFSAPVGGTTVTAEAAWDIDTRDGYSQRDALTLYYAQTLVELLGDGSAGSGMASIRCRILWSAATCSNDDALRRSLRNARQFTDTWVDSGLDVNEDGALDLDDALIMFYTANPQMRRLLGDGGGETRGAGYRRTFLGPLVGTGGASDMELRELIRRVDALFDDTTPPPPPEREVGLAVCNLYVGVLYGRS